jgi:hypothetical protein
VHPARFPLSPSAETPDFRRSLQHFDTFGDFYTSWRGAAFLGAPLYNFVTFVVVVDAVVFAAG